MPELVVVTHKTVKGPGYELVIYFSRVFTELMLITLSIALWSNMRSSCLREREGRILEKTTGVDFAGLPEPLVMLKDFLYTIFWVMMTGKKWRTLVAIDSLNFLSGYVLKKVGLVSQVVFWSIDFTPRRFQSKWMNSVYHRINKFSYIHCYRSWSLSRSILEAQ